MIQPRLIPIEQLVRRGGARPTSEDDLKALESSIAEVGLLNPITVRTMPDGMFEIIAGSHRYAVCDGLGHREILCHVVEMDDLRAELATIDENLCRAELTGIVRDKQTARRKELYEALHPETRNGVIGALSRYAPAKLANASFTVETAALSGRSERSVQRSAERGAKVSEEAAQLMRGTRLDTGIYADGLKGIPAAKQAEKVRRDLAEPLRPAPVAQAGPKRIDLGAYSRFITLSDDLSEMDAAAIIIGIPSANQRADLRNRVRSLLAFLEALDDLMEGSRHA